jgi:hypothetical protein
MKKLERLNNMIKIQITKTFEIDNLIKFIAAKECFEVIDSVTKIFYNVSFNDIFSQGSVSQSLVLKYETFLKTLNRFNEGIICVEEDNGPDEDNYLGDHFLYLQDDEDLKYFIDDYGNLLFNEIQKDIRVKDDYKDIEIEYVGLSESYK